MKYHIFLIILILTGSRFLAGQVTVTGRVADRDGISLPGANIALKGTYEGASADTSGHFRFKTLATGKQVLMVSFVGYKTLEQEIDLSQTVEPLQFTLEILPGQIHSVVVTAGAFETGEQKRPIVLKPMDIATTPSALGDIYGALTTLPGTQVVGEEGGLFVRGGEGYETKTYIDGMQVHKPFLSKMPDIPTRSRFSPILFRGTAFSTGGYSSEYGQALSSVVNLNTVGLADRTESTLMLMSVGMNGSHAQRWEKGSISATLQYINMKPYHSLVEQNMPWDKDPVQTDGTLLFRQQRGKYGILKIFSSFNTSNSVLQYSYSGDTSQATRVGLRNTNIHFNSVYTDMLTENWKIKAGFSGTFDNSMTDINTDDLADKLSSIHQRLTLTYDKGGNFNLKIGEEMGFYTLDRDYYMASAEQHYPTSLNIRDYALYAEPEITLNDRLALRMGLRAEYLSLHRKTALMPRFSMAYRTGDYGQVSLAYGAFRQRPEDQYLTFNRNLGPEKAKHLILNYQYEVDNRILRVELYRKWYDDLVKYTVENNPDPSAYNNNGDGYAQGIDLFWRDSKTVKDLDYWVSYSYIDSRRDYKNFQQQLQPSYVSPHTLSVVMKYFFRAMNTYAGLTYVYASSKTCYNPALEVSSGDRTGAYNDLSLNLLYIRPFLKKYCAILLNVNNIPGFNNVFGYHYETTPDAEGDYQLYPIKPQSKRFFMLGVMILL